MNLKEISALPVADIAAENSALFLWSTYPMLREAMQVIDAWGFKYKSIAFQWVKLNPKGVGYFFGLGRWTRGNTEPCLIAVKGKPQRVSSKVSQLIVEPVGQHSAKPAIVRNKIIELVGDLSRIELFARQRTDGWDAWGNEL
jgi:N6-adenosine-specific RNA methylase IME4